MVIYFMLVFLSWSCCEFNVESYDCHFEIINNHTNSTGTIVSPEWPNQYPSNTKCTYKFISNETNRVQIVFQHFNLFRAESDQTASKCHMKDDHLNAYVMLNDRMVKIDNFCGSETPPKLMSSGQYLHLEFLTNNTKTQFSTTNNTQKYGFKLQYRFVDDFGIKVGRRDRNQDCSFVFDSSKTNNGTFYSPNYPGYYPRNIDCNYEFKGSKGQKIKIIFTYFDVEGYRDCTEETQSDYVKFSNYRTADRVESRLCGAENPGGRVFTSVRK